MRISVVVPDPLGVELERCKRQMRATTSEVVRAALERFLRAERRREAGAALLKAAADHPVTAEQARRALDEIEAERERSDRV